MRFLILGMTALVAGTAAPALAQSPPAPIWQGWYAGVDVGGTARSGQNTLHTTGVTTDSSSSGAGVGIHGGYNWQSGPWVFGGEADWSHSFINGGHDDVDMFSARARAGWAFASAAMIYATAGIATENRFLYDRKTIGTTTASFSDEQQHLGPIVGGGLDTMLGKQISVRGEVLYFIGSREQYNYPAAGIFSASSVSSTFNQIIYRAGATYHFN